MTQDKVKRAVLAFLRGPRKRSPPTSPAAKPQRREDDLIVGVETDWLTSKRGWHRIF